MHLNIFILESNLLLIFYPSCRNNKFRSTKNNIKIQGKNKMLSLIGSFGALKRKFKRKKIRKISLISLHLKIKNNSKELSKKYKQLSRISFMSICLTTLNILATTWKDNYNN